jgi:uncharacterized protein (DUF305 family)
MDGKTTVIAALLLLVLGSMQPSQDVAQSATRQPGGFPAPNVKFNASTEKTFGELMGNAMDVMHREMHSESYNGEADHDFVTMMIPHHQGAVDMAKALLLYGKDPQVRRLAQEIITDQQMEIQLMQLWLKQHPSKK